MPPIDPWDAIDPKRELWRDGLWPNEPKQNGRQVIADARRKAIRAQRWRSFGSVALAAVGAMAYSGWREAWPLWLLGIALIGLALGLAEWKGSEEGYVDTLTELLDHYDDERGSHD